MANTFAHIELSTDDARGARKFYKKVFDWKFTDLPDGGYTMIDAGGGKHGAGGGLQKKQTPEAPAAWMPYVAVDSVKRVMARAAQHGARIVLDYQDIGEMGAIGIFVDPTGATLGVWEAKQGPDAKGPEKDKKKKKKGKDKKKKDKKKQAEKAKDGKAAGKEARGGKATAGKARAGKTAATKAPAKKAAPTSKSSSKADGKPRPAARSARKQPAAPGGPAT